MNPKGTAPGLMINHDDTLIFCVPGVPAEMEYLLGGEVLPRLAAAAGKASVLSSRLLRTWGQSESAVAEMLDDVYRSSTNPSLAFLASGGEIKIRITAKADDQVSADALIAPMESEVRTRLGDAVFGVDDDTIERVLLRRWAELEYTISSAESMTGVGARRVVQDAVARHILARQQAGSVRGTQRGGDEGVREIDPCAR